MLSAREREKTHLSHTLAAAERQVRRVQHLQTKSLAVTSGNISKSGNEGFLMVVRLSRLSDDRNPDSYHDSLEFARSTFCEDRVVKERMGCNWTGMRAEYKSCDNPKS